MLTALDIQDFLLIDRLSLPLEPGLTALTGETGAGKSILLDALGLACGGRSARGGVRQGAAQGVITVAFEPPTGHPVWAVLADNGLDSEDDQVILRRVQNAEGRGRGFVNDRPVSIAMLRTVGDALLEIHGQHDGRGFLTAATHRELLDAYGNHGAQAAAVSAAWRAWQAARTALDEKRQTRDQSLREADYLRHVVGELELLAPDADEETRLAEERAQLIAAEKMLDDIRAAREAIDDDMLETRVGRAARAVTSATERLATLPAAETGTSGQFATAAEKLDQAVSVLMEARATVVDLSEQIDPDPETLSRIEERLFAIRAAARKHGVAADRLPDYLEKMRHDLALIDEGEAAFADLEKAVEESEAHYFELAEKLSANRHKISKILDKAVAVELAPLKLGAAQFETRIDTKRDNPGPGGIDDVEFMVATNPGAPMGPLKTIASGGELSRFVLAMKAALASQENRTVIIFDEVDAGVGGAVADAVGERLARLAGTAQVLVVTHSPQVAARAKTHWQVTKEQKPDETITRVSVLDEAARIEELARMLSGATVTDEARAAARKLVSGEQKPARAKSKSAGRRAGGAKKTAGENTRRKAS